MLKPLLLLTATYVLGSVNFSILLFRWLGKSDPRDSFSGNAGAFNVSRQLGKGWAALILLLDMGRGWLIAYLAARWLPPIWTPAGAAALILGNHFPLFHGFRGGKGIGSYLGFSLGTAPWAVPLSALAWWLAYCAYRQAFIGSFAMIAVLSLGAMHEAQWSTSLVLGYLGVTALLVWIHRANLRRYATEHPDLLDPSQWRPVHYAALAALASAMACLLLWPPGALVAAAAFGAACLAAPYFPRWQFFLPILTRCDGPARAVALTFDDGPDPTTTPDLLALLQRFDAKATFFVVGRKATRHPDLIARIRDAGHAFGNHTESHDVFLMLRSPARIEREIVGGQESLQRLGIETPWLRPPVGITAPRLGPIVRRLGLVCVGFRTRGGDCGNRRVDGLASRLLRRLAPGDIVLLHDVRPPTDSQRAQWLREIEQLLVALKDRRIGFITLADCLTKKS